MGLLCPVEDSEAGGRQSAYMGIWSRAASNRMPNRLLESPDKPLHTLFNPKPPLHFRKDGHSATEGLEKCVLIDSTVNPKNERAETRFVNLALEILPCSQNPSSE